MSDFRILQGDSLAVLRTLPDESVHTCVTSPPYWGLRDYGVSGQIGLEKTPEEYVASMVAVFREVRRVLRADGTAWVNLGDSYAATGKSGGGSQGQRWEVAGADHTGPRGGKWRPAPDGLKPKDLVGIPWRVAFALQQPYEHVQIKRREDRAWLAALTDGEGCITILRTKSPHESGYSYPPVLQVRMCDAECIHHAAAITGYGNPSPLQEPPSQGGVRGSYQWRLNGRKAADIIAEIYPYLLIKRKQAIVAWNHQAVRDSYETKRGVSMPADALEKQKVCKELIQKLNHREPVDIPSWMDEPRITLTSGWYLRSDVIWHKPNPMPESVTDRPTKAHEYIFLLSKSERYAYDHEAIAEKTQHVGLTWDERKAQGEGPRRGIAQGGMSNIGGSTGTRNKRTVWTVSTCPTPEAHFATYPPDLIEPCILAGCPEGGTVLDPFNGAGTTGLACLKHGRRYIGIELNPEYIGISEARARKYYPLLMGATA